MTHQVLLPVQIGQIYPVKIDQMKVSCSDSCKGKSNIGTQAAKTCYGDSSTFSFSCIAAVWRSQSASCISLSVNLISAPSYKTYNLEYIPVVE